MKDSLNINSCDVMTANQSLRNKIEFLEREREKCQSYSRDLEQTLKLNKQVIRELNNQGPNNTPIRKLEEENSKMNQKLTSYYNDYRNINALLLFETQMRIEEKSFNSERIIEFENRVGDLRKSLHDKEDSFSAVVERLRKYEEFNEKTVDEKLNHEKDNFGVTPVHELIDKMNVERNMYKALFETCKPMISRNQAIHHALSNQMAYFKLRMQYLDINPRCLKEEHDLPVYSDLPQKLENIFMKNSGDVKKIEELHEAKNNPKKKKLEPNLELIRLLKKEKLNNEILEEALNEAIEKNEQLFLINHRLTKANNKMHELIDQLRSQVVILCNRLSQFDHNYGRKYKVQRTKSQKGQPRPDFLENYKGMNLKKAVRQNLQGSMKEVEKVSQFFNLKPTRSKMMIKSCSEPRIMFTGEEVEEVDSELSIEQF